MATDRRTKRRFAHELYPHPGEGVVQPLAEAVPYLYALAIGFEIWGTDWHDLWRPEHKETEPDREPLSRRLAVARTLRLIDARSAALHADALLQGLTGEEAWRWAETRARDEEGGTVYDRAVHYGVPVERIKPYPVVEEPDHHNHVEEPDAHGWRISTRVVGKESECPECTEPIEGVSDGD
ncbi:hypothetical protein [Mumia sp. DW29H23]|uniref:hypothetical protein n=1 Tax=Mumia sp. DW29H23 TaxID=3421241 RepID=UPI003D698082